MKQLDFFDVMEWRIKHDRSNIIVVVGEQGSGKSNTGLYLCEKGNQLYYNKEFDFKEHIYNSILEFTKNLNTLNKCFVLLEEVGVELNSKDWYQASNRVFRDIIETFRIKKISLVLTLPNFLSLDKQSRNLTHFVIKCHYPGFSWIFRKWSSYLTDKSGFKAIWVWGDIPDMSKLNPELWKQYNDWHEKYITDKRKDWIDLMELKNLKDSYKREWYKARAKPFQIRVVSNE